MSQSFGSEPWHIDAGSISWCNRPRLYWVDWELDLREVDVVATPKGTNSIKLTANQDLKLVIKEGWEKIATSICFPTFTTSPPSSTPGHRPAGVHQCTASELKRWEADSYRFPPYQYRDCHCVKNAKGEIRVPDAEEREMMLDSRLGIPLRVFLREKRSGGEYGDCRLTLLGNTWSVPVVSWLISQLLGPLGLGRSLSPQDVVSSLHSGQGIYVQDRLFRPPLHPVRPACPASAGLLASKLGNLVSIKGEDIMLTTSSEAQTKFHRLRASVPGRLWIWKVIAGWKWRGNQEHINSLELRAILTSLRWRLEHQHRFQCRMLHLTDSMVCLHALSRGRSSSRKLRRCLSKINGSHLGNLNSPLLGVYPY